MERGEDSEVNENITVQHPIEKSKDEIRKSFIPHKKRVILQELEPILESNLLEDPESSLKVNSSFTHYSRPPKKNLDRMSQSYSHSDKCSRNSNEKSTSEREPLQPVTPPSILRERIEEAREMREYLKKELTELQDFTTYERQVLAVEKGLHEVHNQNSQLTEQNNNLQLEVAEMKKLTELQKTLLSDLNSDLNEMKSKWENSVTEKDLLCKELEEMKIKFVDEQTEKQILEAKWKQREDDLKKSLEEAWSLLHVKEDRITKMNEKISFLYSEREKVKNMDLTFGGQFLPTTDNCNLQIINENITELFELSTSNFLENEKVSIPEKSIENSSINIDSHKELKEQLEECEYSIKQQKNQLEELKSNLANRDTLISNYENILSKIEQDILGFLSYESVCDKENHHDFCKDVFVKVKCDIENGLALVQSMSKEIFPLSDKNKVNTRNINVMTKACNAIETQLDVPVKSQLEQLKPVDDTPDILPSESQSTDARQVNYLLKSQTADTKHCICSLKNVYLNESTTIAVEPSVSEDEKMIKNSGEEIVALHNKISQCEQLIKDDKNKLEILENTVMDYQKIILEQLRKMELLEIKIADFDKEIIEINSVSNMFYEASIENSKDELLKLHKTVTLYKQILKTSIHEINQFRNRISVYENLFKSNQEDIYELEIKVSCQEDLRKTEDTGIIMNNGHKTNIIDSKAVALDDQSFKATENPENKDELILLKNVFKYEEEFPKILESLNINDSQNSIKHFKKEFLNELLQKIKNEKNEELKVLQNKIINCEKILKSKDNEISNLLSTCSEYEQKIAKHEKELITFRNISTSDEETRNVIEDEKDRLTLKISEFEVTIKKYEEEINKLHKTLLSSEEHIKSIENENDKLNLKISESEEKMIKYKEDINVNQNTDAAEDKKFMCIENEIHDVRSLISDYKGTIQKHENGKHLDEMNTLTLRISEYEERIKKYEEEHCVLQNKIMNYEENIKSMEDEKNMMMSKISEFEIAIKIYEEEIITFRNSIAVYEENGTSRDDEKNTLTARISECENTIKKYEEEQCELQNKILNYEENMKSIENEKNLLTSQISDFEEMVKKNVLEIDSLQNVISSYEGKIKSMEDEKKAFISQISENDIMIKNYENEIITIRNSLSTYQENGKCFDIEKNTLTARISECENTIKKYEEEQCGLQNKILNYEENIKSMEDENNRLLSKISDFEKTINKYEEEIITLRNSISFYEENIKSFDGEKNTLTTRISEYENTIKKHEEEQCELQNKISNYEENMKSIESERNLLTSQISDFEEMVKKNVLEIDSLENMISSYEGKIKSSEDEKKALTSQISEFEEGRNSLQNTASNYEDEKCVLQNKIINYEENIKSMEGERKVWTSQISDFEEMVKKHVMEIDALQNMILSYEEKIKSMEDEKKALTLEISESKKEIKKFEEERNSFQSTVSTYESKIMNMEDEKNNLISKITEFEEAIKKYEEERNTFKNTVSTYESKIMSMEDEKNNLMSKISDFEIAIKRYEEEIVTFRNSIAVYEENGKSHDDEKNKLTARISECENTIKKHEEEQCELQNKISNYEENMKSIESERNLLASQISDFEEMVKKNVLEIDSLQNMISSYEGKIKSLEDEKKALTSQISEFEEGRNSLQNTASNYEDEKCVLQNKIINYEENIKSMEGERKVWTSQISDFEEMVKKHVMEIDALQNMISSYEEKIKSMEDEKKALTLEISESKKEIKKFEEERNSFQSTVSTYESKIMNMEDEKNNLISKITEFEEAIKKYEEERNTFKNTVSTYESKIMSMEDEKNNLMSKITEFEEAKKKYEEERNTFKNTVSTYESKIMSMEDEKNNLMSKISDFEIAIKRYEEEIVTFRNSIAVYEENGKSHDDEKNKLTARISECENTIKKHEEEQCELQNKILNYEENMKSIESERNLLASQISDFEEMVKKNVLEIDSLQNVISSYEGKIKCMEDEKKALTSQISENDIMIKNYEDEIITFRNSLSTYQENGKCFDIEKNTLTARISECESTIKNYEEEQVVLQNKILNYEENIESMEDENNRLMSKISDFEKTINKYEEEIITLRNSISFYEENIKSFDDEKNTLTTRISEYENTIKKYEEEQCELQNKISNYEENMKSIKSERILLTSQISDFEEMVKKNVLEIDSLQNMISSYEGKIKSLEDEKNMLMHKISEFEESIKIYETEARNAASSKNENTFYNGNKNKKTESLCTEYEKTNEDCEDIFSEPVSKTIEPIAIEDIIIPPSEDMKQVENLLLSSSSHNEFVNSYCFNDVSSDTTFNSTALDSSAQLEHSVLISKLPQPDYSLREYDPLASIVESYVGEQLDTTLTEEFTEAYVSDNLHSLHNAESLNIKHSNQNKIKELIKHLTNTEINKSDEISKLLTAVKEKLNPTEDFIIYNFCQIIEKLLFKEFTNKQLVGSKMLLLNETLGNLQNIKDQISELKSSFSSLEHITSEDFEIINSHLKNLFLCNRKLFAENGLLKEQLKVSILAEEKLSNANAILKNELNNILHLEKELKLVKEHNEILKHDLEEKCKSEYELNKLIKKLEKILNPNYAWTDSIELIFKLKEIHDVVTDSVGPDHEKPVQELGFLPLYNNLIAQNNDLKYKIDITFPAIYVIKEDFVSVTSDISNLHRKLNSDFTTIYSKLSELNKKQDQEVLYVNELKENIKNLSLENMRLKEDLIHLKTLNENLIIASEEYGTLLNKYECLNRIVNEKDTLLSENCQLQQHIVSFVNSLNDLYFMAEFNESVTNRAFACGTDYINFFLWLQTFLKEIHDAHESIISNILNEPSTQYTLSDGVDQLCKEKKNYFDTCKLLKSELHSFQNSMITCSEDLSGIKDSLKAISSDFIKAKHIFIEDILNISKMFEKYLLIHSHKELQDKKDRHDLEKSLNLLNEKYSDLLHSNEEMENEREHNKVKIQELILEKDDLMRKTTYLETIEAEFNDKISSLEIKVTDYKNMCNSMERKVEIIEEEKQYLEANLKQYGSLGEYDHLKSDQIKWNKLLKNLKNLYSNMKESFEDVADYSDNQEENFLVFSAIFDRLLKERTKYGVIELKYNDLLAKNNEYISEIKYLKEMINENTVQEKNQNLIDFYSDKITEILSLLDYQGSAKMDDVAWEFIKKKIINLTLTKNKMNEEEIKSLEEKIVHLETELSDAHDFKTQFSKELHLLKPDLDVAYLMTLSLADLQKAMIVAIIEKEKDVISDYEMKLASNCDRIQQLEEQEKRSANWVQEIEKENDRLTSEYKQIQSDNEILKADIKSKLQMINDLNNRIMQQMSVAEIKETIRENEESRNQLQIAINEKQTLQLTLASLNDKLIEKSNECEDMYTSLQKKAEIVFNLEKILSKCKTENAKLEKEVQDLRDSMQFNLSNFNDNKASMEKDLFNYKLQLEKLNQLLGNQEEPCLKDNLTFQKDIAKETKSVSTDFNAEAETELEGSLNNHLLKLESLNFKIDELNFQLKLQSEKFDEEFKNQAKLIESLQKELNLANELNTHLKTNNNLILQQRDEALLQCKEIEKLQLDLKELNQRNDVLQNEKDLLRQDKIAAENLNLELEDTSINRLKNEVEALQNELRAEKNEKKQMEEEIEKMLVTLRSLETDLVSSNEARDHLLHRIDEVENLKKEVSSLSSKLVDCQNEMEQVVKEKETSLSECLNNLKFEKELRMSMKNELERTCQEVLRMKDENNLLIEELLSEKDNYSKLKSNFAEVEEVKSMLDKELLSVKKQLREKEAKLEEICLSCHFENSCPYRKELEGIRTENTGLMKQLEHERETFQQWKTNLEEDLHCKVLKISDLESKLKKETQCYKEALMNNSELLLKQQESQEKFKKLEDKLAIQRDVFMKEKSKFETDIQSRDCLLKEVEGKLLLVKHKCEEFSNDISLFLKKISEILKEEVNDLSSAISTIISLDLEKQRLFDELKEALEKAEQLEEECKVLDCDIKYYENVIGNLFEKGKMQEENWNKEKQELEKECLKSKDLSAKIVTQEHTILSLQNKLEACGEKIRNLKEDKKLLESEKLELQMRITDLEKNLQSFKNQEISCLDTIKREMNHLKLELVNKNQMISKLEMRIESESLPFQKKAEMAEKKVEELNRELKLLKQSHSFKQMSSVLTSPVAGLDASNQSLRMKEKTIEKLQEEIRHLITEKSALKLLAQNRRTQIKELKQQLGKKDIDSFQD